MLSPRLKYGVIFAFLGLLAAVSPAAAGLYGFDHANPLTSEEKILDMKYLPPKIRNYREELRENLLMLMDYAKKNHPNFKFIAHEGQELLYRGSWEVARDGYNIAHQQKKQFEDSEFLIHNNRQSLDPKPDTLAYKYLNTIDAIALNNLFCGQGVEQNVTFNHNLGLISIDSCPSAEAADRAIVKSFLDKKILYSFTNRDDAFNNISAQPMLNDSANNIEEVAQAKNILIMTDDSFYTSKERFVQRLSDTNYDIIIIKPLFHNTERFSAEDIKALQFKRNGARRLLIAEMNVTEASPKDYFWNPRWKVGSPSWLARQSFVDQDAVITSYWDDNWRRIISRHFRDIIITGFDGVFFTGLQNHFYFEQQTPLE